jgi:DNA-binding NtrC family response regulator
MTASAAGSGLEVLLADPEAAVRAKAGKALRAAGHRVTTASTHARALSLLETRVFDVVIADLAPHDGDGLELLRRVHSAVPSTDVILIARESTIASAVAALKDGATDYVTKPLDLEVLTFRLERIEERRRLARSAARSAAAPEPAMPIVGRTPAMMRLSERIGVLAASDAPVLIVGETGTGKELVAHSLHERGPRASRPFVAVNCAAFPEALLEAELFGHEAGAFTGAAKRRDGRFAAADGGTLFIDEVAEMPVTAQVKLLRVLEDGAVEPLGTNRRVKVDVRVVAATHRNLAERIAQGLFRQDLYYRLKVLDVVIPPLRERRADLPVLVDHFLRRRLPSNASRPPIAPRAWAALTHYSFPGNVRELEHALEHALVLSQGKVIDLEHLPAEISGAVSLTSSRGGAMLPLTLATKQFEREYLLRALAFAGGKRVRAARLLDISRKNLWEKLRAHGISAGESSEGDAFV